MFIRGFQFLWLVCSMLLLDDCVDGAMTVQQMENAANGLRNVCIPKSGADPELVAGSRKGNFPEDEKFQCYLKCVMGMIKTMKNGRPMLDPILKQINLMMPAEIQDRSVTAAKTCAALDFDANECVAAWQFVKCQYETDPEVFFFP